MNAQDGHFLRQAIQLAWDARRTGERPFGALLVINSVVVAQAIDQCTALYDPTAHAEVRVISAYCHATKQLYLNGCTIYSVAEPCVMCSGAIKWAGIERVVFCVPQAMLQTISGGMQKPTCASLVNTGGRAVEVCGPLLLDEGMAVYQGFDFAAHRQRMKQ